MNRLCFYWLLSADEVCNKGGAGHSGHNGQCVSKAQKNVSHTIIPVFFGMVCSILYYTGSGGEMQEAY